MPAGWYCYDIRGSDDAPGALCYMEENVVVNHAGSVLMPEKLVMPKSGRLDVRDELGFLDEGNMTLREFCEAHQLSYPTENMKFHIRPARPEEAGLFYTPHPEEDKRLGTVGHVRMDFGRSGNEFWHTWWSRGPGYGAFLLEKIRFGYGKPSITATACAVIRPLVTITVSDLLRPQCQRQNMARTSL